MNEIQLITAQSSSFLGPQLILIGGFFLFIYFLIIRPQNKRMKAQKEMIENFFRLSRSSYAEGLGALYAYERQVPEIADTKIKGLVDHYNVSSDEGLEYFVVHKDADVEHREQSAELMNKLSGEEKILAKEAGLSTVKVLWGFLSGLCEKHNIQA